MLREPLVHFLGLGLGLFLLYGLASGPAEGPADRIEVSRQKIGQLVEMFSRARQRPPTERELAGLIEDHVREEVYYREALAMGLDQDDTIVRRRLRQKLEFITDELATAVEPTPEQLVAFYSAHEDRFREPEQVAFSQVYLSPDRRGPALARDAAALLADLQRMSPGADVSGLGDSLMLAAEHGPITLEEAAHRFGDRFAGELAGLPEGRWAGPVESGFGLHLVLIRQRRPASLPPLDSIAGQVEREWAAARRLELEESTYRSLRARYEVIIEGSGAGDAGGVASLAESRP